MFNDNQIFLAGYVASPPLLRLSGGKSHATVRVAFTPRWVSRETGEWSDGPTSFVNVLCWRTLADNVAVCLRKGEPILVMGRLRVRRYQDKEGAARIAVEVEANSIGHDLSRGVAAFSRTRRAPVGASALGLSAPGDPGSDGPPPEAGPSTDDVGGADADEAAQAVTGAPLGVPDHSSEPFVSGHGDSGLIADEALDDAAVAELARQMGEPMTAAPF